MLRALLSRRLLPIHLLALVASTGAIWLGLWQLQAWSASREVQARDLADAQPLPLETVMSPDEPFPARAVGQPVEISGEWVPESTFLVDGRRLDGAEGMWAVTPVAVCDSGCADAPAMLVVRGWTDDANNVPPPPTGAVDLVGWLQPPEGSGLRDEDPSDDVLPELRIGDVIQRVDQDLYGAYVIADEVTPAESPGSTANLRPVTPDSLPEPDTFTAWRNLLYALEWWVFAAFALFVWWRWCADEMKATEAAEVPSSA